MPVFPRAFDAVVAGGGPAGTTTALLLARAGISTLLLEPSCEKSRKLGETLPPAASSLLRDLGIWDTFANGKHLRSEGIVSVWGSHQPHVNDFLYSADGHGWNLDRSRFDAMLLEHSRKEGVSVALGARIISCKTRRAGGWNLTFAQHQNQRRVSARYLVDATGRTGAAALRCLSPRVVRDKLIGVVASFQENQSTSYTLVEAVDDGWFYSTSVPDRNLVVVYLSDADIYAERRKFCSSYFQIQLKKASHTSARVTSLKPAGIPFIVSAATSRRRTVAGPSWIAVGDAALSFDPLSSLGILKALDSAARASESILNCLRGKISDSSYEQWCNHVYDHYLTNRTRFYAREQRWPGSDFWQRRHH